MPALALAVGLLMGTAAAPTAPIAIVACAPGYPGTTAEAQPSMDALSEALAEAAGSPRQSFSATFEETEQGGLAQLARPDTGAALVTFPFLAQYGTSAKLVPRLQVEEKGTGLSQVWSLVAKKGRVRSAGALDGFTILSSAGYAPAFVRGALRTWGELPARARIAQSRQVLSALRKAAAGDDVAVLLDGTQTAALPSLPFAADLDVVARSPPLPVAFACEVDDRLGAARWRRVEDAFLKLPRTASGMAALEGVRMVRFVRPDADTLAIVRGFEKADRR